MSAAFRRRHFVAGSPRASGGGEELRSCHREGPLWVDTVEKLDFLPRSQFLRQQTGLREESARGLAERLTFPCEACVANWRWQRVALSALQDQSLIF